MPSPRAEPFAQLAPFYDAVMAAVPYRHWVDYVLALVDIWGGSVDTVLDLACGTASVGLEFARRGSRVVGVDRQPAMLHAGRAKQRRRRRQRVALVAADMRRPALAARFDLVVCLFDSLNYLLDPADLKDVFAGVAACLAPRGLFVFDVNTEQAFEQELFTQEDLEPDSPVRLRWQSCYDRSTRVTEVTMEFYLPDGRTVREVHHERAHTLEELAEALTAGGLARLGIYEAYTLDPGHRACDRLFYVCRPAAR